LRTGAGPQQVRHDVARPIVAIARFAYTHAQVT